MRFFDPLERRDRWSAEYPSGSYLALMDDDYLAALKPDGHLDLLDLETGKTQTMQGVTEDDLKSKTEVRVLSDHDNVYLIINRKRDNNRYYYYNDGNMATVPVNGSIFAWNRETGQFLWQEKVADQKLVLMHFTHSPLLVFYTRMYKRVDNFGFYATNTLALDKFTGKKRVEVSAPTNYSGFQTYDLSLKERTLEMKSYQSRIRITALAPGSAEKDDTKSKPAKANNSPKPPPPRNRSKTQASGRREPPGPSCSNSPTNCKHALTRPRALRRRSTAQSRSRRRREAECRADRGTDLPGRRKSE